MNIVKPVAYEIKRSNYPTLETFIERVGRICYKSEDKTTSNSAEAFCEKMVKSSHLAMTEHGWVHLIYNGYYQTFCEALEAFTTRAHKIGGMSDITKFLQITIGSYKVYISAPMRWFIEMYQLIEKDDNLREFNQWEVTAMLSVVSEAHPVFFKDIKAYTGNYNYNTGFTLVKNETDFLLEMEKDAYVQRVGIPHELMKHAVHSVLFVCDRGVSHELVRHRVASFAQESTRYCNYKSDKFDNNVSFILPEWFNECYNDPGFKPSLHPDYHTWLVAMQNCEEAYFALLEKGQTPQQARSVLPNSLKTEIIVTANEVEWQHIINLRLLGTTGAPHPQMKQVMMQCAPLLNESSGGRIEITLKGGE